MVTNTRGKHKKRISRRQRRRKRIIKMLGIEAALLIILLVGLWGLLKLDKIQNLGILDSDIQSSDLTDDTDELLKGYTTVALFGIDTREMGDLGEGNRSDTIIIASINNETKEVKMISVYRDTYLNLANDKYNKCNAAYSYGGPAQAISMLNLNLDLNIKYYVSVDFLAMINTIDLLGGIEVDVEDDEWEYVNDYILETAYVSGVNTSLLDGPGHLLLDGVQATSYCRIRYTAGSDFKRTERQRRVLTTIANTAKKASLPTIVNIIDEVFPLTATNFTSAEMIARAAEAMKYEITETEGFPFTTEGVKVDGKGDCVVPADLESNVKQLHEFLYGEKDYYPSPTVLEYSAKISSDTGVYAAETTETTKTTSDEAE